MVGGARRDCCRPCVAPLRSGDDGSKCVNVTFFLCPPDQPSTIDGGRRTTSGFSGRCCIAPFTLRWVARCHLAQFWSDPKSSTTWRISEDAGVTTLRLRSRTTAFQSERRGAGAWRRAIPGTDSSTRISLNWEWPLTLPCGGGALVANSSWVSLVVTAS